jgi:hypothetical protein
MIFLEHIFALWQQKKKLEFLLQILWASHEKITQNQHILFFSTKCHHLSTTHKN